MMMMMIYPSVERVDQISLILYNGSDTHPYFVRTLELAYIEYHHNIQFKFFFAIFDHITSHRRQFRYKKKNKW